ncbi:MAG: shikimate dehydrogenase, partial [Thermoplasmata archaeon]|nr:shikimate dehydrogenase [Thermoplasmata archaeon]
RRDHQGDLMRVCASLSSASELSETRTRMVEIRLDLLGSVPDAPDRDLLVTYRGPIDLGILPEGYSGMIDIGEEPRPETKATVVASHHDFEGTPNAERIVSILNGMDCDISKAAFSVKSLRDLTSILDAARSMKRKHVILGMGPLGTVTRIRASILGNEFSFGYVGEPTAPGQLSAARMEELGDDCMILGVLGNPLSKSKSPLMHNAALREAGINGIYLPFETSDLDQVEEVVRGYGIRGMNVTIPFKQDIMDHIDAVDKDASAIGAVNTVVNDNGRLTGYNTDVLGIHKALECAGFEAEDRRVLVMGTGGAARACVHYMNTRGCDVTVTGRNPEKGTALASDFGAVFRDPKSVSTMMYDLVVNCTPVGMYSDGPYPINISTIQSEQAVFDMTYGKETPLVRHALDKGCKVARGEDMLAGQGAASFAMWTGRDDAFRVMREQL